MTCAVEPAEPKLPSSLLGWVAIFGPGAVIASLTIGAGELIFSARAGAIFGYRLLWFFGLVLALKWVLVLTTARHMVLTGAHPFDRWMDLPGPRGWLPAGLFVMAAVCFPVWVAFHAGTLGGLLAKLTGTGAGLGGGAAFLWGLAAVAMVGVVASAWGYSALERVQLVLVVLMLGSVTVAVFLLRPDWGEMVAGFVPSTTLAYPAWVPEEVARRPVWLEVITYVGVLGGGGYDYLAYVSYLRTKRWGQSAGPILERGELEGGARGHLNRRWVKAVWIDLLLSFAAVLLFSAVFLVAGTVVLGPNEEIPGGTDLLSVQAEFVTPLFPWLKPFYFVGACLTIFGTLYGTVEVAPAVAREFAGAMQWRVSPRRLRRLAISWMIGGGGFVLVGGLWYQATGGAGSPPGLVALLTPANLFTGVLACGLICWLGVWADYWYLPPGLRLPWALSLLNLGAGFCFVALGLKGYWDHSGWRAYLILVGTLVAGALAAKLLRGRGPDPR